MKKDSIIQLIIICCFLVFSTSLHGDYYAVSNQPKPPAEEEVPDYSDISYWWRCEALDFSGTNGTDDYSEGDDVATASTGSITCGAGGYTNNGLLNADASNNGGDYASFDIAADNDIIDGHEGTYYQYFKFDVSGTGSYVMRFGNPAGGDDLFSVTQTGSPRQLKFSWKEGGVQTDITTTDCNFSTGTGYFVQLHWNATTNIRSIHVYDTSGVEVGTGAQSTADFAGFATSNLFDLEVWNFGGINTEGVEDDIRISKDSDRDFLLLRTTDAYPG
jgi:hypothetical protein